MSRSQSSSQNSQSGSGSARASSVQQDYIVRIRYNNNLPAPPNPPKLLDIPNPALAQYTSTGFASKLAREQPLNIELDSELGMPLDMVHIPGVFERDESAIRPIDPLPPIHPNDRALLRPASALGKPARAVAIGTTGSGVSFLRRTEYISNEQSRSTFKSTTSATLISNAPIARKRAQQKEQDENDPIRILAAVMKGFDIANPETAEKSMVSPKDRAIAQAEHNWKNLRHPTKKGVTPVEFYPIFPDPEGVGEASGYLVYKFSTNPVGAAGKARDERLDVALMKVNAAAANNQSQSQSGSQVQGTQGPSAGGKTTFDYYLPISSLRSTVKAIKRKFSDLEGINDTPEELQNPEGGPIEGFKYQFIRSYEAHSVKDMFHTDNPEEVALVFYSNYKKPPFSEKDKQNGNRKEREGESEDELLDDNDADGGGVQGDNKQAGMSNRKKQKGAYWYPILQRSLLKTKRNEKRAEGFFRPVVRVKSEFGDDDEEEADGRVELFNVRIRGLTEEEKARAADMARRFEAPPPGGVA